MAHKRSGRLAAILGSLEQAKRLVFRMHSAGLMAKLLEIERRAGLGDGNAVRALALAAQDELLQIERELIATLTDNDELRRRMGRIEKGEQARNGVRFRSIRAV